MSTSNLDFTCPQCGARVRATLADVAAQRTKTCSRGHRVQLVDQGGGARKLDRSLKDLDRAIRKLGR